MTKPGWTLDDIAWGAFDPEQGCGIFLMAVKAASVVEYKCARPCRLSEAVFPGDAAMHAIFEQWGLEETQHGLALGRWVKRTRTEFDFEATFKAFREGYKPPHFEDADGSVRGSKRGELIARVVESGTTSYYSAMRDATEEPVLKADRRPYRGRRDAPLAAVLRPPAGPAGAGAEVLEEAAHRGGASPARPRTTNSPMPITAPTRRPPGSAPIPTTARPA